MVAAVAPILAAAVPGKRVPQVVLLIFLGILIGPHGLGLASPPSIELLSNIGLGFLFLLAGYELDPHLLRERPGRLAIIGWAFSAALAVGVTGLLTVTHFVYDYVPIGLALTTTALGTLLPILRDTDMLTGRFGRHVLAAGAAGELFPIIAISLFLTRRGSFVALGSLVAVAVAAGLLTLLPKVIGAARLRAVIRQGRQATAQTTLRWAIVLLLVLLVGAARFGLDVVLGAMVAGIVLRTWTRRMGVDVEPLETKLEAVGYGIFIPIFFVASGMTLNIHEIISAPLRVVAFLLLLLLVRGAALAAGLLAGPAAAPAPRDDLHHRDHDAAADRPGRDRAQRRHHAARQRRRPGRRGRPVGPDLPLRRRGPAPLRPAPRRPGGARGRGGPRASRLARLLTSGGERRLGHGRPRPPPGSRRDMRCRRDPGGTRETQAGHRCRFPQPGA